MHAKSWYTAIFSSICCLCLASGAGYGQPVANAQENSPDTTALIDVASVYNGAFAVDSESILNATRLLSGMKNHGDYVIPIKGDRSQSDFLVELAESATIERLRFIGPMNENNSPQSIEVSLSDTSTGNFKVISTVDFEIVSNNDLYDNSFDIIKPVIEKHSGRFIRFRMFGSLIGDPSQKIHAMASLQALGTFNQVPTLPEIAGVYYFQGDFDNDSSGGFYLTLQQDGDWVEGCAVTASRSRPIQPERLLNLVSGGVQNGVLHLERSDASGGKKASGIVTFSSDGKIAHSAFFREGGDPSIFGNVSHATGERFDTAPAPCVTSQQPAQTPQQVWEETLEKEGVLRLYGVNFDLDSDVLRKESHAVLDQVVTIAKENPKWAFVVAGHTDSSGPAAYNRDLSQRRAAAVVHYLSSTGIAPERLQAIGYGADKPLMSNETAAGMAQNRRVELVRPQP